MSSLVIPLRVSEQRQRRALQGQLEHHRDRRLALVEHQQRRQQRRLQQEQEQKQKQQQQNEKPRKTLRDANFGSSTSTSNLEPSSSERHDSEHPSSWRGGRRFLQDTGSDNDDNGGIITSLGLSNCHLVLYSGEISLGTAAKGQPAQVFLVDFDSGSSDAWVPSAACDETCTTVHPTWRSYNQSASSTYEVATNNSQLNSFHIEYEDGEAVYGQHAIDTLRLGNNDAVVTINHFVFAQVTQVIDFAVCEEEEGILGLGNSLSTSHKYPSLLHSILHSHPAALRHNVFAMYLQSLRDDDDAPATGAGDPTATSQLVLGGVDQTHYVGCLQWHSLVQSGEAEDTATTLNWEKYWTLPLEAVKVGGTTLVTANRGYDHVAILDSGSSYLVGPQDSVAHMVKLNNAKCFTLEQSNNNPVQVACDNSDGFDGAVLNSCDDPFFNLEFIVQGVTYVLEKEDLLVTIDTLFGKACILRVVGAQGMEGWVLGDAFLNKYYAAFDFENQRVGLALAAENAEDTCDKDLDMDITHFRDETPSEATTEKPQTEKTTPAPTPVPSTKHDTEKEVFDKGDAMPNLQDLQDREKPHDFDFSQVGGSGGTTPTEPAPAPVLPPPSHNEPPKRQPVSNTDSQQGATDPPALAAAASSSTNVVSPGAGSNSTMAVSVVVAALVVFIVALVVRRRRGRKREMAMFEDTWREAERAVVQSHRNLNYRDHERSNAGGKISYQDKFEDEIIVNFEDDDPEGHNGRNNFVLDAQMLQRMN